MLRRTAIFWASANLLILLAATTARAETVAQWDFNSGNFLADSTDNGYTLTNSGATQGSDTPDGSTGSASFNGNAMLSSAALDLAGYDIVKISWWQKITGSQVSFVYELGSQTGAGTMNCVVNSSMVGGSGHAYASLRTQDSIRSYYGYDPYEYSLNQWQQFSVQYSPQGLEKGRNPSLNIVVCDGAGNVLLSGTENADDAVLPFVNLPMYIGSRGSPAQQFGISGFIDNMVVEGLMVPEPSAIALLVSAMSGLVCYAWRKRK